MRKKVVILFGTRPEAIKLAPVILALKAKSDKFHCIVCSTGQHREMVDQVLQIFNIKVDHQMDAMSHNKNLAHLTAQLFKDIDTLLENLQPDWLIVQGDTTSAFVGATCAFYRKIKIAHVEAGLRTHDKWAPFPEEINRVFITQVADLHLAPTELSAKNLKHKGKHKVAVHVTGNTVVDALLFVKKEIKNRQSVIDPTLKPTDGLRRILVTTHRRESFGDGLKRICTALLKIADEHPDVEIIIPVHLNPAVKQTINEFLNDHPRIKLISPQPYLEMIYLIDSAYIILSDSGGIQEEAPSFRKPLLVLRDTTERPEVIHAGCAQLVGTNEKKIVKMAGKLLTSKEFYKSFLKGKNPFGDGSASKRIVKLLD